MEQDGILLLMGFLKILPRSKEREGNSGKIKLFMLGIELFEFDLDLEQ
jgi:hypothetical protein